MTRWGLGKTSKPSLCFACKSRPAGLPGLPKSAYCGECQPPAEPDPRKEYERVKARAHKAVAKAVADGCLNRPDACELCGERHRIYGHHEDYSKPLDVDWLCAWCHRLIHPGPHQRYQEDVHEP